MALFCGVFACLAEKRIIPYRWGRISYDQTELTSTLLPVHVIIYPLSIVWLLLIDYVFEELHKEKGTRSGSGEGDGSGKDSGGDTDGGAGGTDAGATAHTNTDDNDDNDGGGAAGGGPQGTDNEAAGEGAATGNEAAGEGAATGDEAAATDSQNAAAGDKAVEAPPQSLAPDSEPKQEKPRIPDTESTHSGATTGTTRHIKHLHMRSTIHGREH